MQPAIGEKLVHQRKRAQQPGSPHPPVRNVQVLSYEQVAEFERSAAITVLRDIKLVQGEELKFAHKALDMSQPELAEYLGVAESTVSKWENNREAFKRPAQLALLGLLEAAK